MDDIDDNGDGENGHEGNFDEDAAHDRLLAAIDTFTNDSEVDNKRSRSGKLRKQMSASIKGESVSMDALLGALDDSKDLRVVKKNLNDLGKVTPKNVEKVVSQRIERNLRYESSQKDMGKWQDTVTSNRHARTLDIAKDIRQLPSHKSLINKFKPETDMEREIQMVLISDETVTAAEEDELRSRDYTPEEIRERQASLAKVKSLMFYEQMKRHRLNKIKSKAYHRIRKKQKLNKNKRNGEMNSDDEGNNDDEESNELAEKEELKRIQERMDMKHKNTSKWGRMALKYGKTDKSLRAAYHDSVLLGQELSKKIQGSGTDDKDHINDDDDDDDDDDSDEDDNNDNKKNITIKTAAKMKKHLESLSTTTTTNESTSNNTNHKYKKLFDMDFMKKASEKQMDAQKQEAREVLREIEKMEQEMIELDAEERGSDNDNDINNGDDEIKRRKQQYIFNIEKEKKLQAAELSIDNMLQNNSNNNINNSSNSSSHNGSYNTSMLISKTKGGVKTMSFPTDTTVITTTTSTNHKTTQLSIPQESVTNISTATTTATAAATTNSMVVNPWLNVPSKTARIINSKSSKSDETSRNENKIYLQIDSHLEPVKAMQFPVESSSSSSSTITSSSSIHNKNKKLIDKMMTASTTTSISITHPDSNNNNSTNKTNSNTNNDNNTLITDASAVPVIAQANKRKGTVTEVKPLLLQTSQEEILKQAFASVDFESDFMQIKNDTVNKDIGIDENAKKALSVLKAGWGDWAGPGQNGINQNFLKKREKILKRVNDENNMKKSARKDSSHKMYNVILSEDRLKAGSKFKVSAVPHPFTTREEYERSIQMPLGAEWNASQVVRENTKPDILIRAGRLIEPIKLGKKREYSAANICGKDHHKSTSSSAGGAGAGVALMNGSKKLKK